MNGMLLFQSVGMDSLDPDTIFVAVYIFMWAQFLWEAYTGRRQWAVYRESTSVPPELEGILDHLGEI